MNNLRDDEENNVKLFELRTAHKTVGEEFDDLAAMLAEQRAFMKKWKNKLRGSEAARHIQTGILWLEEETKACHTRRYEAGQKVTAFLNATAG